MKKNFFNSYLFIPFVLVASICLASLFIFTGCKKNSDSNNSSNGSSSITISGTVGAGLNGNALVSFSKELIESLLESKSPFAFKLMTAIPKADSILAVPLYQGSMNAWAMPYAISGQIDASGNMTISLPKDLDFVILLIDSTQINKIDRVVGYLNLSDSDKGLMRIPVQNTTGSSMNVGTITESSGSSSANSSKTLTDLTADFSVDISLLREYARTDDILQMAKNIYANYISQNEFADTAPYFAFNGSNLQTGMLTSYSDPASIPYSGYGLYFTLAKPGLKIGDVCATSGAKILKLTPPTTITSAVDPQYGGVGTSFTAIDNSGVSGVLPQNSEYYCGGSNSLGAGSIYIHGDPAAETFGFNWGAGTGFAGNIAAGNWVLSLDNVEIARFDLRSASVVDSNNKPTVYVPSLKIDRDANTQVITSISLKLYTWDTTTSSFVHVTDPTGFLAVTKQVSISMTDYGQTPRVEGNYDLVYQGNGIFTVTDFKGVTWKQGTYGAGTAQYPATSSLVFAYSIYGASIRFDYR